MILILLSKGILGVTEQILDELDDVSEIAAKRLNSDPIENMFGHFRGDQGKITNNNTT